MLPSCRSILNEDWSFVRAKLMTSEHKIFRGTPFFIFSPLINVPLELLSVTMIVCSSVTRCTHALVLLPILTNTTREREHTCDLQLQVSVADVLVCFCDIDDDVCPVPPPCVLVCHVRRRSGDRTVRSAGCDARTVLAPLDLHPHRA